MSIEFLKNQTDYIYFLYSLAFVLLATVCRLLIKKKNNNIKWTGLQVFSIFQAILQFMFIVNINFNPDNIFYPLQIFTMSLSFLFLMDFAYNDISNENKVKPLLIYIPLICLIIIGNILKITPLSNSLCYSLCLIGSIWSAITLYKFSKKASCGNTYLLFMSIGISLYGIISVISIAWIKTGNTLSAEIISGIAIVMVTVSAWGYFQLLSGGEPNKYDTGGMFISLAVIIVGAFIVTQIVDKTAQMNLTRDFIIKTKSIGATFTLKQIRQLNGSPEDIKTDNFKIIKKQLYIIKQKNNNCRFIYLLGWKDKKTIFFLGSEPDNSPEGFLSGELYNEPPEELKKVFSTGQPIVRNYSDKYGKWVSCFVPIRDPGTDQFFAVWWMDIDGKNWDMTVANQRLLPLAIAFLLSILLIFIFIFQESSIEIQKR